MDYYVIDRRKEKTISYEEFKKAVKIGIVNENMNCPVTPVCELLQGKWRTQVLYELIIHDSVRFGQFKKDLPGITNSVLTAELKDLEKNGLVKRTQYNEIPPHVEYSLTEKGNDLLPLIYAMMNFGLKYFN